MLRPAHAQRIAQPPRPGGNALVGDRPGGGSPAGAECGGTRSPHLLDPLDGLDGPDEDGGRFTFRPARHVQAVVHPVDKVHVGPAGSTEHDGRPFGQSCPGVRGTVVGAAIGLDFHDPADPDCSPLGLPHEPGPEDRTGCVEDVSGKEAAREEPRCARARGQDLKAWRTVSGKTPPKSSRMNGTRRLRVTSAVTDP